MQDWIVENWIEGCGYREVLHLLTIQVWAQRLNK